MKRFKYKLYLTSACLPLAIYQYSYTIGQQLNLTRDVIYSQEICNYTSIITINVTMNLAVINV